MKETRSMTKSIAESDDENYIPRDEDSTSSVDSEFESDIDEFIAEKLVDEFLFRETLQELASGKPTNLNKNNISHVLAETKDKLQNFGVCSSENPHLANNKRDGLRVLDEVAQIKGLGHFAAIATGISQETVGRALKLHKFYLCKFFRN
ncbi:hypothetical protein ILUMI_18963 [Ignelater luminosus]|uniref:Uncharacterized protein n=1 Tax=Ignelater luminosus TaxID=2038154 RepID=A0A8K0CH68_IGNLU|nr:hypothetical protein ILUMI_18963 [Ignelater luminosus]